MKISLNWLNEFVDLSNIKVEDIVSRFSLCTAEIEGFETKKPPFECISAQIKTTEQIPATHLSKLTVTDGKRNYNVICGAPNVREGLKIAFANKLPPKTIQGIESQGMCLSCAELGISADHSGILELPTTTEIGKPIVEIFPFICDTIIEIDNKSITNRPDLWGHYGIARELSVLFNKKLKPLPTLDLKQFDHLPKLPLKVETPLCNSYGLIHVDNITKKTTPLDWATRLFYLDINSHGFLVDLSNYIMLELGQPNHTFDAGKVGKIGVKTGIKDAFLTLKDHKLTPNGEEIFICSDEKPVGLAGIMGGKNSEIDLTTKDTLIEFANFDSATIRKTANKFGIRTDASARFEKTLDTNLTKTAAARMIYLLKKFDKTAEVKSAFTYIAKNETSTIDLKLDIDFVQRFCGVDFKWSEVTKCLAGLGFNPKLLGKSLNVTVPIWRASKDVTQPVDVIEEIIRTYGYDKISPKAPTLAVRPFAQPNGKQVAKAIKTRCSQSYALVEVHSYIWSDTPSKLKVVNSCVKGCDYVRDSLIPSILKIIEKNKGGRVFEIGSVFDKVEEKRLCICIPNYAELAQILRELFNARFNLGKANNKLFHPKNNASVEINGKVVGYIGVVPTLDIAICEINLNGITNLGLEKTFPQPTKFQKNKLDFTFDGVKTYGEIEDIFNKFKHDLNMGFRFKGSYNGNFTIEFTVGSFEKTLTSDDINDIWKKIIDFGRKNGLTLKE